jgi:DNA repair photolyase
MSTSLPIHGRGSSSNPPNRFIPLYREAIPGWTEEEDPAPRTRFFRDESRKILNTNDSPDIPFTFSVNPYRGCEHGCAYCMSGDTPILMGDGSTRRLDRLRVGDSIYGTARVGWYRRYVVTNVLAHWRVTKPAYRVRLADGTELITGSDHRFLTERGWKFVTGRASGSGQRPFLTVNNKLMGIGGFAVGPEASEGYRIGYLCGMIRGDGLLGSYDYSGKRRARDNQHQFRLALIDDEGLSRTADYLRSFGVETRAFVFQKSFGARKELRGIRTSSQPCVQRIRSIVEWPKEPTDAWQKGFLAGIFDAEGSFSAGILRITNTCPDITEQLRSALARFGFDASITTLTSGRAKPIHSLHIRGGLGESLRFLHFICPAISRKRSIVGQAVKGSADLRVLAVEQLKVELPLYDMTTGTGDFIANGVVSHNCYARPGHEFLGLSAGLDFESQIFVKEDAPELLQKELASPKWIPQTVSMSGVTDPYQPVERRLQLTRRCLEVFAEFRNPVGIVTKSALVARDRDVLGELARYQASQVFLSITTLDTDLARNMEPRAATPTARLRAIRELSDAGIPVGVLVAPIIPGLNDHEAPMILKAAAEAGALCAGYVTLRLPFAVKDLFVAWLEQHYPHKKERVLGRLRETRGGKLNDSQFGRRMRGEGNWADLFSRMFKLHGQRAGISDGGPELSAAHFTNGRPRQGDLFE